MRSVKSLRIIHYQSVARAELPQMSSHPRFLTDGAAARKQQERPSGVNWELRDHTLITSAEADQVVGRF